jgi:hypothetical protein
MRLAFLLGKTKKELLEGVSGSREIAEWMAYLNLEPPHKREDERTANLMAAVYNASGNMKKAVKAKDFLPEDKPQEMSIEESIQQFRSASTVQDVKANKGKKGGKR